MTETDDSHSREALRRLMHPNYRRMTDEEYRNSPKRNQKQSRVKGYDKQSYDKPASEET